MAHLKKTFFWHQSPDLTDTKQACKVDKGINYISINYLCLNLDLLIFDTNQFLSYEPKLKIFLP